MKKKTLVPLIIFLLGICLVSLIVYITDTHEKKQRHTMAQLNATTYGERIKNEITDIFLLGEYVGNCTAAPCVGVCGIVV